MLIRNPEGGYSFLPGGESFSNAVLADGGHEIIHATFKKALPLREGFRRVEDHLRESGLSVRALCATELRSPAPFSRSGFLEFNAEYRQALDARDVRVEERIPIARSNIAPALDPPSEPSLFGFSYAAPASAPAAKSFVVSGIGELRPGPVEQAEAVRARETSPDALAEKTAFIVGATDRRLNALGVGWDDVTHVNFYSVHPLGEWFRLAFWESIGAARRAGAQWHLAHPPITDMIVEMDARGVFREIVLA